MVDKQLAFMEETLSKSGYPQTTIDAALKMQKKFYQPVIYAPINLFGKFLGGIFLSLIIAIFVKKEGNPLINSPEEKMNI